MGGRNWGGGCCRLVSVGAWSADNVVFVRDLSSRPLCWRDRERLAWEPPFTEPVLSTTRLLRLRPFTLIAPSITLEGLASAPMGCSRFFDESYVALPGEECFESWSAWPLRWVCVPLPTLGVMCTVRCRDRAKCPCRERERSWCKYQGCPLHLGRKLAIAVL